LSILFLNPNFLILDEPTNDLDLQTLRTLEEFLLDFPGCILIVSHDRYFMDRMVDHLFAFEGDGVIKDFPGNYTLYREHKLAEEKNPLSVDRGVSAEKQAPEQKAQQPATNNEQRSSKPTFKEKFEFEQLEKEIPALQKEKTALEEKMNAGSMDYDALQKAAERISTIVQLLDEKEMRWLELSERI